MAEIIKVKIWRFDPEEDQEGKFQEFMLEKDIPGMRILQALKALNERQAANISYRYSCEEWQCGSCAILVNGIPKLACKEEIYDGDVLEPLSIFPVIKDLLVDRSKGFNKHRELANLPVTKTGKMLGYEAQAKLWESITCMQCDVCLASCPMLLTLGSSYKFSGPEFMIQLYRFAFDPRFEQDALGKSTEDGIWECFTCKQCEINCPQRIPITRDVAEIRAAIMETKPTLIPSTIRDLNRNLVNRGNEFGLSKWERTAWAEGLDVPPIRDGEKQLLYFVGCAEAADPRDRRVARAMVSVLRKAGVDFGILGEEEVCASDAALQTGETGLFEELARTNIGNFRKYNVKRIITTSPHVYHVIKNEYPKYGRNFEVLHYVQFLEELMEKGVLKPTKSIDKTVTYHDSCFLGRYNGIFDAPRKILRAIPGLKLVEMVKNREQAECCGGGGGGMWMEIPAGERVSERRVGQAVGTGAEILAVACPWCRSMFDDAIKTRDLEEKITVKHILELVDEATG